MILSSCEALPPLSTPSLKELAKVVPYIIVQELPDSAAANARKRMASETVLKPVPNILFRPFLVLIATSFTIAWSELWEKRKLLEMSMLQLM